MHTAFAMIRFGVGPTIKDQQDYPIAAMDWIKGQLSQSLDQTHLMGLATTKEMIKDKYELQQARKTVRMRQDKEQQTMLDPDETAAKNMQQKLSKLVRGQFTAHIKQAIKTRTPVLENMLQFWTNHLTVSAANNFVRPIVSPYVREAIAPNIKKRFQDLLWATITHPAMILYLDNQRSVGPNSRLGKRRSRGLNENLAREILELHTLGVKAGYTLSDIQGLAKILSGWTVQANPNRPHFAQTIFRSAAHEPGTHHVLGKAYSGNGEGQLKSVIKDLARHPKTALHIATKLAQHYISDQPEPAVIKPIRDHYLKTGGDLQSVTEFTFALALEQAHPFKKARSHQSYVIALFRALDIPDKFHGQALTILREMGQPMLMPPGPDGWPDTETDWITPQGLNQRIKLAERISQDLRSTDARDLVSSLFGPLLSEKTRQHVARAESPMQALTLALASPEMNYR